MEVAVLYASHARKGTAVSLSTGFAMTMCNVTHGSCNRICHCALSPKQIGAASIGHRVLGLVL